MSFLPGMMGILVPDPSTLPLTSLTYSAHTYLPGTSGSAAVPADVDAGDLIVTYRYMSKASPAPAQENISGFTNFQYEPRSVAGLGTSFSVDAKIADGSEGGATLTLSASLNIFAFIIVYKPNRQLTALTAGTAVAAHSTGNPAAFVIPTSSSTAQPSLSFAWWNTTAGINALTGRTLTPTEDVLFSGNSQIRAGSYFQLGGTPSDVTGDQNASGNNNQSQGGVWIGLG